MTQINTVQQAIDALMKIEDKTQLLHLEMYDETGFGLDYESMTICENRYLDGSICDTTIRIEI